MRYRILFLVVICSLILVGTVRCGQQNPSSTPAAAMETPSVPVLQLPSLEFYPGSVVLTAEQSLFAYEVMQRVPATTTEVTAYYTDQLRRYSNTITTRPNFLSTVVGESEYRIVFVDVHVLSFTETESLTIIHVGSNTDEPMATFIGPPQHFFHQVTQPFTMHTSPTEPVDTIATVERSRVPQPPVHPRAVQRHFEEFGSIRQITYDIPLARAQVQAFYDAQFRSDEWTYVRESGESFDTYAILQGTAKPAFSANMFLIPITSSQTIAHIVLHISGPGVWSEIPPPPTPKP